jgi:hypothetical protein
VHLESAVLERHARAVALCGDGHLDLGRLRRIGVELPFRRELPGQQQPLRPLDLAHEAPVALAAIVGALVEAPALACLDHARRGRGVRDVVAVLGPPVAEAIGEQPERRVR